VGCAVLESECCIVVCALSESQPKHQPPILMITVGEQPIKSKERSPFEKLVGHSSTQRLPCIIWNSKVRYRLHNRRALFSPHH
jgi:hypothetical protein